MEKLVTKTVGALTRFGERMERRLSTGNEDDYGIYEADSGFVHSDSRSAFRRPLDTNRKQHPSTKRDLGYGGARRYSSDNLVASPPGYNNFTNYRQDLGSNPYVDGMHGYPYGMGMQNQMNYGYGGAYPGSYQHAPYGSMPGNVAYAPDYYIAERRQVELVPAPPPRYIQQPVPVPVPVDRPVPQPYPVEVPRPVPVDRPVPVPVPVPSPVPIDRPVPVPVPVAVPSPPVQVPVPVPVATPVPCYVPVPVPVPSPPPSPVMVENSVTHTQRWITGSPVMMHHQHCVTGPPVYLHQQRPLAGSPVMGMNPYQSYGTNFRGY